VNTARNKDHNVPSATRKPKGEASRRPVSVRDRLQRALEDLSGQKRKAAEYILSHLREVTMLSLRKIALRARVNPAALVALAHDLNYTSYNEFKASVQEEDSGVLDYFSAGAQALQNPQARSRLGKLSGIAAATDSRNIESALSGDSEDSVSQAAQVINDARRVYVVGVRASFGIAHYLHYLLQLIRDDVVFLTDLAGMSGDQLATISKDDVLVAFGFYPYVKQTLTIVDQASEIGAHIVGITDSRKSPLLRKNGTALLFRTESPWVLASVTSAVAVSQVLVAQIVGLGGEAVLERLRQREKLLKDLDVFVL